MTGGDFRAAGKVLWLWPGGYLIGRLLTLQGFLVINYTTLRR